MFIHAGNLLSFPLLLFWKKINQIIKLCFFVQNLFINLFFLFIYNYLLIYRIKKKTFKKYKKITKQILKLCGEIVYNILFTTSRVSQFQDF